MLDELGEEGTVFEIIKFDVFDKLLERRRIEITVEDIYLLFEVVYVPFKIGNK